jgi:RND family efflux transporter MFP subunit
MLRAMVLGAVIAVGTGAYALLFYGSENASIAVAPSAQAAKIDTIRVKRGDIAHSFNTNATLEAFESADLYPKVSGYLSEVRVDIGDHVRQGQVLAIISLPETEKELAEAEATVNARRADLALQKITAQRQEGLLKIQGTSQQTYDEAKSKESVAAAEAALAAATADKIRTMLEYRRILAPFDGVVAQRQVNRGDFVQSASSGRTTPLFTVQRVDTIRVFCNVPESDVARLRVGLNARLKAYGMEASPISGIVARFAGRLDPETRNMRTEIDVPNPDGVLYPGMYAQVSLETEAHHNVLLLPLAAVGTDPAGKYALAVEQGRVVRRPIRVGMIEDGLAEIVEGVAENAEIVAAIQSAPPPGTAIATNPRP